MRHRIQLLAAVVVFLMGPRTPAAQAQPEQWVKLLIHRTSTSVAIDLVRRHGGEVLHDYDSFRLVRVPAAALSSLTNDAAAAKLSFEVRPDFDRVHLPRYTVDTRQGKPGAANSRLAYASGTRGLYVLQMIGPPTAEWIEQLRGTGIVILQGLQANAALVVAAPEDISTASSLPFVQWADIFQPFEKAAYFAFRDVATDVIVHVANVDGKERVTEELRKLSPTHSRGELVGPDYLVHVHLNGVSLAELLRNPIVIGVYREPNFKPSDERQALSATPYVTSSGAAPTSPGQYNSWLQSICPACGNLNADGFRIGIADTGLDAGENAATQHADLAGRQYFGGIFNDAPLADICPGGALSTNATTTDTARWSQA